MILFTDFLYFFSWIATGAEINSWMRWAGGNPVGVQETGGSVLRGLGHS